MLRGHDERMGRHRRPARLARHQGRVRRAAHSALAGDLGSGRYGDLVTAPKIGVWETWACAAHFVRLYGADASLRVAERSDELLAAGDVEGARAFAAIVCRIKALRGLENSTLH